MDRIEEHRKESNFPLDATEQRVVVSVRFPGLSKPSSAYPFTKDRRSSQDLRKCWLTPVQRHSYRTRVRERLLRDFNSTLRDDSSSERSSLFQFWA